MRSNSSRSTAPSTATVSSAVLQCEPPDVHETAEHVGREAAALLVGEHPDRERVLGLDAGGGDRLDHLEPREHTERTVVDAAGGDAVDVAAGEHRRLVPVRRPGTDDVADAVDVDPQPEVTHPGDHEVATLLVGVGQREARDAAGCEGADLGQRVESRPQARERGASVGHHRVTFRSRRTGAPARA